MICNDSIHEENPERNNKLIVIYPLEATNERYTMVNNAIFDHLMRYMTPSAFMVFCAIYRKTRGYHKDSDMISYSQIRAMTGLSCRAINRALNFLQGIPRRGEHKPPEYKIITAKKSAGGKQIFYALNEMLEIYAFDAQSKDENELENYVQNEHSNADVDLSYVQNEHTAMFEMNIDNVQNEHTAMFEMNNTKEMFKENNKEKKRKAAAAAFSAAAVKTKNQKPKSEKPKNQDPQKMAIAISKVTGLDVNDRELQEAANEMACGEYGVEDIEKFAVLWKNDARGGTPPTLYQLQNEIFRVDFMDETA